MTDTDWKMFRAVINSRLEIALKRLKEKPDYSELLQKQDASEEIVGELLHKLEKDERITIRCHYEGEAARESEEQKEAYIQGMMDCIRFLSFLGAFSQEACL